MIAAPVTLYQTRGLFNKLQWYAAYKFLDIKNQGLASPDIQRTLRFQASYPVTQQTTAHILGECAVLLVQLREISSSFASLRTECAVEYMFELATVL